MKPNANYKMSGQAKRFAATILDPHKRGEYKRAMIDAELSAQFQPKREKGRRDQSPAVGSAE